MSLHVLYISFDGLLEPLGHSQVLRVLRRVATVSQTRFTVLSVEKETDFGGERHQKLSSELESEGITWLPHRYRKGARGIARNIAAVHESALSVCMLDRPDFMHARSYLGGQVARTIKLLSGIPFIFDIRGFWVDERIQEELWFTTPSRTAIARGWERNLYQAADAIVSLTQPAADSIAAGRFGEVTDIIEVIPTLVENEDFEGPFELPNELAELRDSLVVGWVGSINACYRLDASIKLVAEVLSRNPEAQFLAITKQASLMSEALTRHNVGLERVTITTVPHHEMPAVLSIMDWGLLIQNLLPSQAAQMPTKLAEFFAAGVRPIQYGCNWEVSEWVRAAGSGIVLPDTEPATLIQAASEVVADSRPIEELADACATTMHHFGVRFGALRYANLYQNMRLRSRGAPN